MVSEKKITDHPVKYPVSVATKVYNFSGNRIENRIMYTFLPVSGMSNIVNLLLTAILFFFSER